MPEILLLTAETLPHDDYETALVAASLSRLGVDSRIVPWTRPDLAEIDADLAVVRTTWDYTTRLPEFLRTLAALRVPVTNPIGVVHWNCHKAYLTELAGSGVPVVPTELFRMADVLAGQRIRLAEVGAAEVIVKPATSAGAKGVGRFPAGSPEATEYLRALLQHTDALVQPFRPEVSAGERSVIFLGGAYSHAVRKVPAADDFRVQEQFGGVVTPHSASPAELRVAAAALDAVPGPSSLSYARIDLIGPEDAPVVMELELIEPELFLHLAAGSPDRFAAALVALL